MTTHRLFTMTHDMLDMTSMNRPDTSWLHVDRSGHRHQWYCDGSPARAYSPAGRYELPTLVYVADTYEVDEDGDEIGEGHYECRQCHETVRPGSTACVYRQHVPGVMRFFIDGRPVSDETFDEELRKERGEVD